MPSVPQFLGNNIPIYEEGALISTVTAVMQEYCRNFPPRIFLEIRGGHTFIVMEPKSFQYIAGIIPIGPGRRHTLSIYSTTTPLSCHCKSLSKKYRETTGGVPSDLLVSGRRNAILCQIEPAKRRLMRRAPPRSSAEIQICFIMYPCQASLPRGRK